MPTDYTDRNNEVDEECVLWPEQMAAFESIESSDSNVFLTGKAGTGKSVLLRYFIRHTRKKVAVLAPTGIAAINVGGQTIHSFFKCNTGIQKPEFAAEVYDFDDERKQLYRKLDAIVIDEISMVRADIMEMINAKLKAARDELFEPFGGCQIIVFGDLYQLPPVLEKDLDARSYFQAHYDTPYFFSAPVVRSFPFTVIELQHIHRQSDEEFIKILNSVRTGSPTNDVINRINSRFISNPPEEDYVTLTSTNERADAINSKHLASLLGNEYVYPGITEGLIDPKDIIAEKELRLKVGARVIMLKNDSNKRWVNGTIGTISRLTNCSVAVIINNEEYLVDREEWETKRYKYNQQLGSLEQEIVGKFIQFPIKLAYAMTIHKSQGQTYDGVIIDLNRGAFATGQTYVALSRCKSFDNLFITSLVRYKDIFTDPGITAFMSNAKVLEQSQSSSSSVLGKANDAQKEAICTVEGPLLITAGPGTGKTFTLVQRIIYLIKEHDVKPEEIFVATFTDKAANELITRITKELANNNITADIGSMMIGTFHSLCLKILREYSDFSRVKNSFRIIDEFDQQYLVYNNLAKFKELDGYDEYFDSDTAWKQSYLICHLANTLSEELVDLYVLKKDSSKELRFAAELALLYQSILYDGKYMDYAALQVDAYHLLSENIEVLRALQNKLHYFMIDEYQDTNYIQEQIILLLGGTRQNICVVGDDDQGLYRFRGATVRNIIEFSSKFSKQPCHVVHLDKNYRSTPQIIEFYNKWMNSEQVIWDGFRIDKQIVPARTKSENTLPVLKLSAFCEYGDSMPWFKKVRDTLLLLKRHGIVNDFNQIAFLFRSVRNNTVRELAEYLEKNGIDVYSPRAELFFSRSEIKMMIGCLLYVFPSYSEGLMVYAGEKDKLYQYLGEECLNYYRECLQYLNKYVRQDDQYTTNSILSKIRNEVATIHGKATFGLRDIIYQLLSLRFFEQILNTEVKGSSVIKTRPLRNLSFFVQMIDRFEYHHYVHLFSSDSVEGEINRFFNQYLKLLMDKGINEFEDDLEYAPKGSVSFLTIHQSKGMEFPVVFVDSLSDGQMEKKGPEAFTHEILSKIGDTYYHRLPFEPSDRIDQFDKWRLYYTAFSRAQDILILTSPERVSVKHGRYMPGPSFQPFFDKLDSADCLDQISDCGISAVKQVELKERFSFTTDIATYDSCARLYKLQRKFGFAPNKNVGMLYGELIHLTIEKIHKEVVQRGKESIKKRNIRDWLKLNYDGLKKAYHMGLGDDSLDLALHQMYCYYENHGELWDHIYGIEYDVVANRDTYLIQGKIDLICSKSDKYQIYDFKTGKREEILADAHKFEQYKHQLFVYGSLLREQLGVLIDSVNLFFIGETGDNTIMRFDFDETKAQNYMASFESTASKIQSCEFENTSRTSERCHACQFRYVCHKKNIS